MCVAAAAGHCGLVYRVKTNSNNSSSGAKAMTHAYVQINMRRCVRMCIFTHFGIRM